MSISRDDAIQIMNNGIYYCPANKHYPQFTDSNVVCNFCNKTNLVRCIGYNQFDLCLGCVANLEKQSSYVPNFNYYNRTATTSASESVSAPMNQMDQMDTFMLQDSVRPNMYNTYNYGN